MKRNAFLITAVLFSLATAATAAEHKNNDVQPPSKTEQTQVARYGADGSKDDATSTTSERTSKVEKKSQPKHQQDNSEGDPQASQNQVEFGGAG
jgi:hypothetical protein